MYVVPDGRQTSGFGPYSLTYLTVELAGHDSWAAEGAMPVPGTFFVYYWNSSERVRRYTREAAGIPALPGSCSWQREGDKLISTLTVDDQPVIRAVASVTDNLLMPLGGHLNYYSHRQFGAPEGGRAVVSELLEFPLPFVMDLYEATVQEIEFNFPEGDPAAELAQRHQGHLVGQTPEVLEERGHGLGQIAAEATLDDLAYYRANFRRIIATREKLSSELTQLGFQVLPSRTNFILARPPRFPAKDWLEKLRERKVLVRWFGAPEVKDYLRVTIGAAKEAAAVG